MPLSRKLFLLGNPIGPVTQNSLNLVGDQILQVTVIVLEEHVTKAAGARPLLRHGIGT